MQTFKLNYSFQEKDARDYIYNPTAHIPMNTNNVKSTNIFNAVLKTSKLLPTTFSLQSKIKQILDQGQLGSCVSNAFAQYILMATNNTLFISRLFHYYCGRLLSQFSNLEDTGLYIRTACQIISKVGACQESIWKYNINNFSVMPPLSTFQFPQCRYFRKYTYAFITKTNTSSLVNNIKAYLTQNNLPVMFGMMVYSSFLESTNGIIPMPNVKTEQLEGGHCMLIVGYNDNTQQFMCVNSWGSGWGNKGYCFIPYEYIANPELASDFCGFVFIY